ncbi:hypothetical protein AA313_de0205534 [Arthrobotrys entomopaga]|nr:hypothetical protein AA313_de0205534 [Arthrobotrys entomopaga]
MPVPRAELLAPRLMPVVINATTNLRNLPVQSTRGILLLPRFPPTTHEHVIHLFQASTLCFLGGEKHVNQRSPVEGCENEIHFPVDRTQKWRDRKSQHAVSQPVGHGRHGYSLGSNAHGEDFSGIRP